MYCVFYQKVSTPLWSFECQLSFLSQREHIQILIHTLCNTCAFLPDLQQPHNSSLRHYLVCEEKLIKGVMTPIREKRGRLLLFLWKGNEVSLFTSAIVCFSVIFFSFSPQQSYKPPNSLFISVILLSLSIYIPHLSLMLFFYSLMRLSKVFLTLLYDEV